MASDNDDLDVIRQCRKSYVQSNALVSKFHMCSHEVNKMLFRSLCNPMYTLQLLHTSRQNTICKLKVAYNNAIHSLMGYARWCRNFIICGSYLRLVASFVNFHNFFITVGVTRINCTEKISKFL